METDGFGVASIVIIAVVSVLITWLLGLVEITTGSAQ